MIQVSQIWGTMSNLYWLSEDQMARLRPYFPKSHGVPRVDDRRVLSGIIFINRNGLCWCDAPWEYRPHKTLYNRWRRWNDMGATETTSLRRKGCHNFGVSSATMLW